MYFDVEADSHTPGDIITQVASNVHAFYHDAMLLESFPGDWHTSWITIAYRDAEDSLVRVRVADAQAGTGGESYQDAQVAYLINWATGDIRRGGKPRTYVPGVLDGNMADSAFLEAGTLSSINPLLINWLTAITGHSIAMQLVEMSFRNGNAWRTDAHSFPIIGGSLNPVVATQRRRVDRLRPH
jgi:hypothetical protein